MKNLFQVWFLLCICGSSRGSPLIISTPDLLNYVTLLNQELVQHKSFQFKVQASGDVHLALIHGKLETDSHYEVYLGTNGNYLSGIRFGQLTGTEFNQSIFDGVNYKAFWVYWNSTSIVVGEDGKVDGFSVFTESNGIQPIQAIGFKAARGNWQFPQIGPEIRIGTPATKGPGSYIVLQNLLEPGAQELHFKVKICNDAHVALINGDTVGHPLYEIGIGEFADSKSAIREGIQKQTVTSVNGPRLDCNQLIGFKINWDTKSIYVGKRSDNGQAKGFGTFMTWKSPNQLHPVQNIAIGKGFGTKGEWVFHPKVQVQQNVVQSTAGRHTFDNLVNKQSQKRYTYINYFGTVNTYRKVLRCSRKLHNGTFDGFFTNCDTKDKRANMTLLGIEKTATSTVCAYTCTGLDDCIGFSYNNNTTECELVASGQQMSILSSSQWLFYRKCFMECGYCDGCCAETWYHI